MCECEGGWGVLSEDTIHLVCQCRVRWSIRSQGPSLCGAISIVMRQHRTSAGMNVLPTTFSYTFMSTR